MNRHARSPLQTLVWIVAFLAIGAILAWAGMRLLRPGVTVTRAVNGPVIHAFYSTGTVQPEREFIIRANLPGILTTLNVDKGSVVKQGEALAVVNEPALVFALEKASAELKEKQARASASDSPVLIEFDRKLEAMADMLEISRREQQRQTMAMEQRAGSQADLDRALDRVRFLTMDLETARAQRQAKLLELQREVDVARAAVNTAQWNLDQLTLRAPCDGVVLDRPTSQGTRVALNDPILRLADVAPAKLVVRAAVDEEDVAGVDINQVVRLTLYSFPGRVFSGRVARLYPQADADRRTFEVDVRLDQPEERLQPGMTGELAFVLSERQSALVVPSQAVQNGSVWVVDSDGALVKREVKVGLRSIERTEILDGVTEGEVVMISPAGTLRAGQHVSTTEVDAAVAAGLNKSTTAANGAGLKRFN